MTGEPMGALLGVPAPKPAGVLLGEPVLEIIGLCIGYGPVSAVVDISLVVRSGRITTLIGSNGAGKTTIMKGITGL
ncbi:MAG: ribose transport system ATP-binding protein, partial [Acetobacteraceae bacterium]|nr:ribose transport system ATP-binding protein [Acetobacteraceae bacterium]